MIDKEHIVASYCKDCHCIVYSRNSGDYRSCDCGKQSIDMSYNTTRKIGDLDGRLDIRIIKSRLLDMVLAYDKVYGNRFIKPEHIDGYYGKFTITKRSNMNFFAKLIKDDPIKIEYLAELMIIKGGVDDDKI